MKHLLILPIISLFIIHSELAYAQNENASHMLNTVLAKLEKVNDYRVNIEIELDVDFINMPVKRAVMYYKHPRMIKFESDEFIMLPQKGLDFSMRRFLKKDYTAILTGYEDINKRRHYVIKVIPTKTRSNIVLSTLWLDTEGLVISRVENNTRSEGSYAIDFTYTATSDVLPSEIKITFEVVHFNIPLKFIGKPIEIDEKKLKRGEKKMGVVYLRFSDYRVNIGLGDEFFEDQVWDPH